MTSNPIPQDGEINAGNINADVNLPLNSTDSTIDTPKNTPKKPRAPRKKKIEVESAVNEITENTANTNATNIDNAHTNVESVAAVESSIKESTIENSRPSMELNSNADSKLSSILSKARTLYRAFRPTEKLIFTIVSIVIVLSAFSLLGKINDMYSVELPTNGGTYTEAVVGYARFINPLLGYTDADKDMINLIYSGLLKPTPEGKLVADLAKSWEVSDDGLTYTFVLKDGLTFHDGKSLTTDDIEFTIQKAQDPLMKSPRAENWTGVTLEKISPTEIKFILKKPYAPFLENMTLGILPKHIWSNIEHEAFDINTYNREPVGSGPFKIKKAYRNETGIYEYYDLVPFEKYSLGTPYISHLIIKFYKSEGDSLSAYTDNSVDALGGIAPDTANKLKVKYNLRSTPLPRVFGLFFNQNNAPVLVNKEVREALNASVNRLSLINTILQGWGAISKNAIPRSLSQNQEISPETTTSTTPNTSANLVNETSTQTDSINNQYIEAGKKILTEKGWKQNTDGIFEKQTKSGKTTETQILRFTISTSNVPELKHSAEILKDTWTKLGADVKVEIFEPSDLTQKVIRPRKYDSLLFGNVVGRDLDLYPFWHSSQRNDPGLNIALYTNIKADKVLETIRTTSDETKKADAYKAFENQIQNDIPAIFLYSPDYIYATSRDIHNLEISNITTPSERFMNVHKWYTETEKVWKIFAK